MAGKRDESLNEKILRLSEEENRLKEERRSINEQITANNAELMAQEGLAKHSKKFAFALRRLEPDQQQQELLSMRIFLEAFEIGEGETVDFLSEVA